ncbi:MAG: tetratricopeptide repeat-containing sensor histidine kinase [Bacteroidetes bacterium]|nr:tetratricopeptide repeat-containing sensor histidine kinase [Bacteroidota bacterium]
MKLFFACVVSLGFALPAVAQDDTDVAWYENLFRPKKIKSIENEIPQAISKRLKAQDANDKPAEVKALIELGVLHLTHVVDYEQAMGWLIRSLAIEDSLNMRKEKIFTCLAMARVFEDVGDNYKSLEFLSQAQRLSDQEKNRYIQTLILNESGRVKAAHGKEEAAFEDYELALEYARELKQQGLEADALIHLGQLLTRKKENTKALNSFKDALAIYRSMKDKLNEAIALNEVGEMYRVMKNHERALANHVAALEIRERLKDDNGLAQSYNNVGALYFDEENFKRAISNLQLALQSGRKAQDQGQLMKSYDYLSKCYREQKDFKKALEYRESFLAIEDFIGKEKNERQLLEAQNRYVMQKQELQIDKLEGDREQREKVIEAQDKLKNNLILLIAFGMIIGALVLYLYFLKRRSAGKLQELNATKDKLFSIIGHDLKGPLNSLTSFSSLLLNHIDKISKEEIKMLSQDIDKSLKNLFTLLENLLEWSRSQTGSIDFKSEEFDLADVLNENEILLKVQAQNKKIEVVNENKIGLPVKLHRHSINTVVRNLLSNAIKFTPEGGKITLNAEANGSHYSISVTDTGVGMSAAAMQKLFKLGTKHSTLGTAKEAGTGLGLILCKDFIEKNGGTIGVESKEGVGSKFYFTVPKWI